jgi:hypothetical protein
MSGRDGDWRLSMLKVERCMQFRLMLSLIISEHPTSAIKDRTPFGSAQGEGYYVGTWRVSEQ